MILMRIHNSTNNIQLSSNRFVSLQKRRPRRFRISLEIELLEGRCLPSWSAIGPGAQHDPNGLTNIPHQDISGRVSALAITTVRGNDQELLLGAAGGGVWGSSSFTGATPRSEEHTSELQSPCNLVCR